MASILQNPEIPEEEKAVQVIVDAASATRFSGR